MKKEPPMRPTRSGIWFVLWLCALAGCGDSPSSTPPGPEARRCTSDAQCGASEYCEVAAGTSSAPTEGTCRTRATPPPPPPSDAGSPSTPLAWAGTWNVRATYTARCMWSSAGAPNDANLAFTVTARLSGANDDLAAELGSDYAMTGNGNDTRLTLSGQFPGRDHNDNAATIVRRDNQVTIDLREVRDGNTARGTIEGSYETSGGISCDIQSGGTVTFER